jgi:hypothetical protein
MCYGIAHTNPNVCNGHGDCLDINNCTCTGGYFGERCDEFNCDGHPNPYACNGHGFCYDLDLCICDFGWNGTFCDEYYIDDLLECDTQLEECEDTINNLQSEITSCLNPDCDPLCGIHGNCVADNNCECYEGWTGDSCDTPLCLPSCVFGNCTSPGICTCEEGWLGHICN